MNEIRIYCRYLNAEIIFIKPIDSNRLRQFIYWMCLNSPCREWKQCEINEWSDVLWRNI